MVLCGAVNAMLVMAAKNDAVIRGKSACGASEEGRTEVRTALVSHSGPYLAPLTPGTHASAPLSFLPMVDIILHFVMLWEFASVSMCSCCVLSIKRFCDA
jgi:hypothetical protein